MSRLTEFSIRSGAVYILSDINETLTREIVEQINFYLHSGKCPPQLHVYINSYGGSCADATAIINAFKLFPGPVITHVIGDCMSAAVAIAACGDWRIASRDSMFMFHAARIPAVFETTAKEDATALAKWLSMEEKRWVDIMSTVINRKRTIMKLKKKVNRKTKISRKKLEELSNRVETYTTALESLKLGIVDEIS